MSRMIDADALLYDLEVVPLTDDGGVDANDLDDIIKRQPTIETPHWIPCSERLPAYGEKCLVTFRLNGSNDSTVRVSYCYVQKEGFWSDAGFDYKATAWMPLPEPYKEADHE